MKRLVIYYSSGATQVVRVSDKFDGNWKDLANHIADGRGHTFKVE